MAYPDPWMEMAIDAQFVPLVRLLIHVPSTLMYLEDHEGMRELKEFSTEAKDMMDYLWCAVEGGYYAETLTEIVWGDDEDVEDVMLSTLGDPEYLWDRFIDYIENRYYADDQ